MSRISFLVGFDRAAQTSPAVIAGAAESDTNPPKPSRRDLGRKSEENLIDFWEKTRLGLVRRMREKNEQDKEPVARRNTSTGQRNLNVFMTSQIKRKAHVAKAGAAKRTRLIIHPNDPRKLYWDLFVGVMICYSMVLIPWRICYKQDADGTMLYFDYFVDCVFGADIVLCFNAAYFEEDILVYNRGTIARRYLSTWFVPDVLGTVPIASLTNLFINTVYSSSNLQGVKLLRVVRGIRLLKLMRILRLSRKMAHVDFTRHLNPAVVRLVRLLRKIVFAAHLLGCMWFMVNECDIDGGDDLWRTCGGKSLGSKYLASLYWTIATLMSVGYGDISANDNHERLFALVTMVIGSTAFGFIIAMVTVIVETMDPQATAKNIKMDEVREYMGVRKLSKALQLRMRKHFDHVFRNTSVFREVPILRDIPYAVRVKLVADTRANLVRTLTIFEDLDMSVVTEMVYRLKPMQLRRKEYVGKAGDVLDDVFFVVKGRVEARLSKPGKQVLIALHTDGSDFELSSLVRCRPMQFTYRAVAQSELMWLDKDDLETLAHGYNTAGPAIAQKAETQSELLEECLALDEIMEGSDYRQAQILLDWRLVEAGSMSTLVGDGLLDIVDANRPCDTDDGAALIRTLRPVSKVEDALDEQKRDSPPLTTIPSVSTIGDNENEMARLSAGTTRSLERASGTFPEPDGKSNTRGNGARATDHKGRWPSLTGRGTSDSGQEQEEGTPPDMEEALETAKEVANRWIILPNVGWKQKWDMFCVILIALSVIVVPFRIGFDALPEGGWLVVDLVTDITFAFDILINFRMAYPNGHVMVTSPRLMASHYVRGWFTTDLLSTVPFDRIMSVAMGDDNSRLFRGLKLVKVVRMMRLLRLFRLLKIARFQVLAEEFMELNTVLFRGLKLVLTLALLGHFFGCFWSFVSLSEEDTYNNGSPVSSMWWESLGLAADDLPGRYIASIYWAFTTMTTVGYGDVLPVVDLERAYATVIMVIGATVFGYIVGSVSALASNPNGSQARETVKILAVSNYLDEKKVRQKLKQAVKKHVEHFLRSKSPFDERSLMALMPPSLRQETTMQIHKDTVSKIPIFKHLNPNHIAHMLRHMEPSFILAGDWVYSAEHGSEGVYFLLEGLAEVVRQEEGTDGNSALYNVKQGNFFGHEVFLQSELDRRERGKMSVRALVDCSLCHLSEDSILLLVDTQPDLGLKLQRALRRAIGEQDLASPLSPESPRSAFSSTTSPSPIAGKAWRKEEIGVMEAGIRPGGGDVVDVDRGSRGLSSGRARGAKVMPTEGIDVGESC